jgi:hypothetical protein
MSTESDLRAVLAAGLITADQHRNIIEFLRSRDSKVTPAFAPKFDLTHVLWYAGALLVIGAMGIFTTEAFNRLGGWALTVTGGVYSVALMAMGHHLWQRRGLRVPGGLLIAAAVSMVPMMIYGVQEALDLWRYALSRPGDYADFFPYVHGSWLYMELGAILAAAVAIYFYPFPFLFAIGGVALWFLSMDLALWFTTTPNSYQDFDVRRLVSLWFGVAVILAAWIIDARRRAGPDLGFWLHIFGALTFWGALSLHEGGTQLQRLLYCLINVGLIGLGIFLGRRVYAALGAVGIATYLGYLAYDVFKDVILFSFALSAIGIAVISLGLLLNRRYDSITTRMDAAIPASLRWLRPARAPG